MTMGIGRTRAYMIVYRDYHEDEHIRVVMAQSPKIAVQILNPWRVVNVAELEGYNDVETSSPVHPAGGGLDPAGA
jgi:hypothetical protein